MSSVINTVKIVATVAIVFSVLSNCLSVIKGLIENEIATAANNSNNSATLKSAKKVLSSKGYGDGSSFGK